MHSCPLSILVLVELIWEHDAVYQVQDGAPRALHVGLADVRPQVQLRRLGTNGLHGLCVGSVARAATARQAVDQPVELVVVVVFAGAVAVKGADP